MRLRSLIPLALLAVAGCKDKDGAGKTQGRALDLDARCRHLAAACGDKSKHIDKIESECKALVKMQVDKGCVEKANAAYLCFEKELCGKAEKVWAFDDLRVLGERQKKCATERDALAACVGK